MLKSIAGYFRRPADFKVGGDDHPYLLRWWLIPRNRFFNIYLHQFLRDDDDRALHDHPWINLSWTLKGRYDEIIDGHAGVKTRRRGSIVFRRARHLHRIELARELCGDPPVSLSIPAWTLFFTGPVIREWGFRCPQGWRHWRDFTDTRDHGKVGRGCE